MSIQTPEQVLRLALEAYQAHNQCQDEHSQALFDNAAAALSLPAAAPDLPRVELLLPDGDEREAKVRWTEWTAPGHLRLCISVSDLPAAAVPTEDETLLTRALYYLEADAAGRYGVQGLEEMVAAGDHPVVADLRKRLGGSARFPARAALASPAPAAAPEQQQQDIRDGSALSASAPSPEQFFARIAKDKGASIDFLKRAGILDDSGQLAAPYRPDGKETA